MDTLKNLGQGVWNFVTNPPVEVTQATLKFVNDTAKCLSENVSTFAQSVLDAFKGIF